MHCLLNPAKKSTCLFKSAFCGSEEKLDSKFCRFFPNHLKMASRIHTKGATSGYFRVHTMIMSQSWRIPIESNGPMDQWFVTEMYALKTAVFQRRIQDSLEPMTCIG